MIATTIPVIPEVNIYINDMINHIMEHLNVKDYSEKELKEFMPMESRYSSGRETLEKLKKIITDKKVVNVNQIDYCMLFMLHSIIDIYYDINGDETFVFPYKKELEIALGDKADIVKENIERKWGSVRALRDELFRDTEYCFE